MNNKILTGLLILVVLGAGAWLYFSDDVSNRSSSSTDPVQVSEADSVVEANNKFAFDFYSNVKSANEGKNIFFSPYSISTALGMVYEGARGQTANQIGSVFYLPTDDEQRRNSVLAVYQSLNPENPEYQLSTANGLWVENNFSIRDEYKNIIEQYYRGEISSADFRNNPGKERESINSWVEDKTQDKIKDLFPSGSIDSSTRSVLANAIYFKGTWVKEFDEENTRKDEFYVDDNRTEEVDMMHIQEQFNYMENDDLQLIELPYNGKDLSMLVLLPREKDGIEELENSLSLDNLESWKSDMENQKVKVYIPKFKFTQNYNLNTNLKELGMLLAFTPPSNEQGADLTGISDVGERVLYISSVIHKAFVEVNEEGTEAAAATGVGGGFITSVGSGSSIPVFRSDHPFVFMIQDKRNGNLLFMGKVVTLR